MTICPTSYCYNWRGIANGWGPGCPEYVYQLQLGLGFRSRDMAHSVQEPEVWAPSEMYTVADVRATVNAYMDTDVKPAVEKKGVMGEYENDALDLCSRHGGTAASASAGL